MTDTYYLRRWMTDKAMENSSQIRRKEIDHWFIRKYQYYLNIQNINASPAGIMYQRFKTLKSGQRIKESKHARIWRIIGLKSLIIRL